MTIKLNGLDFFAHHGVSDEEQKIGNKYTVDVELVLSDQVDFQSDNLANTVDYAEVYNEVKAVMNEPTRLLETLAYKINSTLINKFPKILTTSSTVSKHNPPIKGVCTSASVTITKNSKVNE